MRVGAYIFSGGLLTGSNTSLAIESGGLIVTGSTSIKNGMVITGTGTITGALGLSSGSLSVVSNSAVISGTKVNVLSAGYMQHEGSLTVTDRLFVTNGMTINNGLYVKGQGTISDGGLLGMSHAYRRHYLENNLD